MAGEVLLAAGAKPAAGGVALPGGGAATGAETGGAAPGVTVTPAGMRTALHQHLRHA